MAKPMIEEVQIELSIKGVSIIVETIKGYTMFITALIA